MTELYDVSPREIDALAAKIRADTLSGYAWNVPLNFVDAAPDAKEHWRELARKRILAQNFANLA